MMLEVMMAQYSLSVVDEARGQRQIWKDPRVGSAMLGEQNKLPCNMMLATIFSDKNQQ